MASNDHTVPQMYLRRFAVRRRHENYLLAHDTASLHLGAVEFQGPYYRGSAFETNVRNVGAMRDFYTFIGDDGVAHRGVEDLLGRIETRAGPALNALLDGGSHALPPRWPLNAASRHALAFWTAAQLLRTTRQRARLNFDCGLALPRSLARQVDGNSHLMFMLENMAGLAYLLAGRPWGLGFSDACLLTGDCPMLLLNGQDNANIAVAVETSEIIVPLDSHRFLLMPGPLMRQDDPRKRSDHLLKLHGMLGNFVVSCILDAAQRHVYFHPSHHPLRFVGSHHSPRLPQVWAGDTHEAPRVYLSYTTLPWGNTVERRWLVDHPPDRGLARGSA